MASNQHPIIGLWGQFDTNAFDPHVRGRIAAHELQRRLPHAEIRWFAPFGTPLLPVTAAIAVESLSPATAERVEVIAATLALIVRIGTIDTAVYDNQLRRTPTDIAATLALISDPPATTPVHDDPRDVHPGALASRVWDIETCAQRLEFLRAMHWWPQAGPAHVVDAATTALNQVGADRESLHGSTVIINGSPELKPPAGVFAIPPKQSSLEDTMSALANATSVTSDDPVILSVAASYGVACNAADVDQTELFEHTATLDRHYDGIANAVSENPRNIVVDDEVAALKAALTSHQRRLAHERIVFANYVQALRSNAAIDLASARESRTLFDKISARLLKRR